MKVEKLDLRIRKTKEKLYEALIGLMKKGIFEDIRVSDICEKAGINRSTFYAHFEDKYMLLDEMIRNLKERLKEELVMNMGDGDLRDYYMKLIEILLLHFDKEKDIYAAIVKNNRNSVAMDMVYDAIHEDVLKRMEKGRWDMLGIPKEIVVKFYLGAIFNVGRELVRNSNRYSKEDIVTYLDKLLPKD